MRNGTRTSIAETGCTVHGLGKAMSQMKKAVGSLEDLQPALRKIAEHGARELQARVPVRTGHLKGTVKTLKRARKASVSIGTKKYFYAPFVNYGTKYQRPQRFVTKAKNAAYPYAQKIFNQEIKKKLKQYGMD